MLPITRKSLLIGAAGSVALLGGGVAASAATGITTPKTLHLVSTTVESRFVQIGHSGAPMLGDEFVIHQKLADQQGHAMGNTGIVCTFTSVQKGGATNCVATASLPRCQDELRHPALCNYRPEGEQGTPR